MNSFKTEVPTDAEPVILMITRRQVEQNDMTSVIDMLKIMTISREDLWLYRQQMALIVSGYETDPRELIDVVEVREFLREFALQWPYWAFFFNQIDDSILLLASCCCGSEYPGGGAVAIDPDKLQVFLIGGFEGMNGLYDKHNFPEEQLEIQGAGLLGVIKRFGV